MARREMVTDRLPDPEQVREGAIGIDNCSADDLPEEYMDVVRDVIAVRRERRILEK